MTDGPVGGSATAPLDEIDAVLDALDASDLSTSARDAVVAALAGVTSSDSGLRATVRSAAGGERQGDVFLSSLRVSGFRGIGHEVVIDLDPAPGLTVVSGRNGSGKSSIAESMDVLLTGSSDRWRGRNVTWRDAWQHLSGVDTAITAKFAVSGVPGGVVLEHRTKAGLKPDEAPPVSVMWPGSTARDLVSCGWADAVRHFRPFLSYNELGGLIEGTGSDRYKALSAVLDLGRLEHAVTELGGLRTGLDKQRKDLEARRKVLAASAAALAADQPRASELASALSGKPFSVGAVDAALADRSDEGASTAPNSVFELSRMRADDLQAMPDLLNRAAAARERRVQIGATNVQRSLDLADLLHAALHHHRRHGAVGDVCDVCGAGTLDEQWATDAAHREEEMRATAQHLTQAQHELGRCMAAIDQAFGSVRGYSMVLRKAAQDPGTPDGLKSASMQAADAVDATAALDIPKTEFDEPGRERVREIAVRAVEQIEHVASIATDVLAAQRSAWTPLRNDALVWRSELGNPVERAELLEAVKAAEVWLADQTSRIRTERFAPLREQASVVWSRLRRDSNVELAEITLGKKGKIGSLDVEVDVDGEHRAGLGVLSQGEIHAMALSLFLPRAAVAQSPFKFLIIDDPVQAMDPAKVEALAQVLADEARTRQIVVFTHDERFAQAVDRLQLKAKLFTVMRDRAGRMTVEPSYGPTSRLLRDASSMLKSADVPPEVMSRVVPNLCRQAIESACDGAVRRRWMTAGMEHGEVEERLLGATKLTHRLAMVLFDDASRTGDVMDRLNRENRVFADAAAEANRGSHGTGVKSVGALEAQRDGTRKLCAWIEQYR